MDIGIRKGGFMRMSRAWIWTIVIVSVIGVVAPISPADARRPIRSGAVSGGPITTGPDASCEFAADCRAWLESGCKPALAGLNPAVHTSIVNVAGLAGRRTERQFLVRPGTVSGVPAGVVIGGFRIQFWSSRCGEVLPYPEIRDCCTNYYPSWVRNQSRFRVPAHARWMTATADDNILIRWELY
jgi:hypothetical protein